MKTIMEDLLTGWSVNDGRLKLHGSSGSHFTPPNGQGSRSGGSITGASLGRTRFYGWHSSQTFSDESREGGGAAGPRFGSAALRVKEKNRLQQQMYSPYFCPVGPAAVRRRPGNRTFAAAVRTAPCRPCNNSAGITRRSRCVSGEPTALAPLPMAPRLVQSVKVGSRAVSPPRKTSEHIPRSPGGAFLRSLAQSPQPCDESNNVLPDVRCQSNNDATNLAFDHHPQEGNVHGGGAMVHLLVNENRRGSDCSSFQESPCESPASDPAVFLRLQMRWEAACAMEASASQRCVVLTKMIQQLKNQIDEASGALESVKMQRVLLQERMRSFTALQLDVGREERKCRELHRLAEAAVKRKNCAQVLQPKKGLRVDAATELHEFGEDKPTLLASLAQQRDSLQLERTSLRQAIRAASAESCGKSTNNALISSVAPRLQEAERRRLEQSIAALQGREQQLRVRARRSEMHADSIMENVEKLRTAMRQTKEQYRRKVVDSSDTTSVSEILENVSVTANSMGSCFVTELAA
ncbi:hypothetical protein TraAM80_04729 [Trypanosoma rangeli]|uniref:Uncharacterized protein n=1 Tax=Trypanosoma rangeli TaxID=5698 RepID=A0A422NHX3_TRYRA|nr:uncharacterized protein TraAM80_04729 [Trypanosoma rangeli]RNF05083.1 hypothetical protein TraAM80_04729 [Trypanosoma rangeli]|eukprot:RNF05083.1 hypothetical protein TraAM80_04729 [Trypanosoma rangeli]